MKNEQVCPVQKVLTGCNSAVLSQPRLIHGYHVRSIGNECGSRSLYDSPGLANPPTHGKPEAKMSHHKGASGWSRITHVLFLLHNSYLGGLGHSPHIELLGTKEDSHSLLFACSPCSFLTAHCWLSVDVPVPHVLRYCESQWHGMRSNPKGSASPIGTQVSIGAVETRRASTIL